MMIFIIHTQNRIAKTDETGNHLSWQRRQFSTVKLKFSSGDDIYKWLLEDLSRIKKDKGSEKMSSIGLRYASSNCPELGDKLNGDQLNGGPVEWGPVES